MIKATKKNITLLSTMLMGPISLSLLILAVYIIQPKVEAKLTSNVKFVLHENNISAEVFFSGRDGVLKGDVDSQEIFENAEKLSLGVFGTRIIRNQLNVRNLSLVKTTIPSSTIIESLVLVTPEKIKAKENIKSTIKVVETVSNNKLSDIDRIMANMQKLPLLKPKYESPILTEKKYRAEVNTQLVLVKKSEKIPDIIEIKKAYSPKEYTKPVVLIALSNNLNNSEDTTKEKKLKNKKASELLDIIEDFNAFLEPSSSIKKVKNTTHIKKEHSVIIKTLDNIDLSAIRFTDKSAILLNESYSILDQISLSIETYYHTPIDLTIYANDSDIAYARGVSIRDYLVKKGVKRTNIGVSGHTITADKGVITPISIKVRK